MARVFMTYGDRGVTEEADLANLRPISVRSESLRLSGNARGPERALREITVHAGLDLMRTQTSLFLLSSQRGFQT